MSCPVASVPCLLSDLVQVGGRHGSVWEEGSVLATAAQWDLGFCTFCVNATCACASAVSGMLTR